MKRAVRQIAVLALLLITVCAVCRFLPLGRCEVRVSIDENPAAGRLAKESMRLIEENPGVIRCGDAEFHESYVSLRIDGQKRGSTLLSVENENGDIYAIHFLRVGSFSTVYDESTGSFSGEKPALIANALFWLAIGAVMLWNFFQAKGAGFYSYTTVYFAGFSLFSLTTGITLTHLTIAHLSDPLRYPMFSVYSVLKGASAQFMLLTAPLVITFSAALIVSNVFLIRREGKRLSNALAFALGAVMILGEALGGLVFAFNISGSEAKVRFITLLQNTYATVYVYLECMLAGAAISAGKAARLKIEPDKDYIIILGCRFRKDGSLPPLLKGRADRALDFLNRHAELRRTVLIPSGGQGPDESMSEAEAIKRYLIGKGIQEEQILTEDRSRSTYENLSFSKALIDVRTPKAKAAFATSSYHVFRSGVWANRAGLHAEGIGSKAKWWYWPNAFVRECLGLLKYRWKQELLLLLLIAAFFWALELAL